MEPYRYCHLKIGVQNTLFETAYYKISTDMNLIDGFTNKNNLFISNGFVKNRLNIYNFFITIMCARENLPVLFLLIFVMILMKKLNLFICLCYIFFFK
jgi:hypothetical protein